MHGSFLSRHEDQDPQAMDGDGGWDGRPDRSHQDERRCRGILEFALCAAFFAGVALATPAAGSPGAAASCPASSEVAQVHVIGLWRAEFEGLAQGATLLLEKHPEYEGGLSGGINRNGSRGVVAGDVGRGEFNLEESADGKRISGTFVGDVVEGSCGREIRGIWQDEEDSPPRKFVLRKL